jgi:3-hydroxybutyryl-CoA dehydratase
MNRHVSSGPRLREGSEYLPVARTIRGEDITAFAELSGDFSPLHTDDEWVRKNTPFSSRIALAP